MEKFMQSLKTSPSTDERWKVACCIVTKILAHDNLALSY